MIDMMDSRLRGNDNVCLIGNLASWDKRRKDAAYQSGGKSINGR